MKPEVYQDYFLSRSVNADTYDDYVLPAHLIRLLPEKPDRPILDIGCGFCQGLKEIRKLGFTEIEGVDISLEAAEYAGREGLPVSLIKDLESFIRSCKKRYDLVIMSHVIEHIDKSRVVEILHLIRSHLLTSSGALYLATPNAQSPTGCYWAYEDFTHTTIFTAGSMIYVLRQAGYESIEFVDPNGLEHLSTPKKIVKNILQSLYRINKQFWNRAMTSSYHLPSPEIYSWELRVLAR